MKREELKPLDPATYSRYAGIRTFMRVPYVSDDLSNADVTVIGLPVDMGATFRKGANFGPSAIREMSVMLRNGNPSIGVDIFKDLTVADCGDVFTDPCSLETTNRKIEAKMDEILKYDTVPLGLGGDHSVDLPELRAIAKKHGPVAIVQFDSHLDLSYDQWGNPLTHGTMFVRAMEEGLIDPKHSVQVGIRGIFGVETIREAESYGFTVITAQELHEKGVKWAGEKIRNTVGDAKTHFTFDIDFFDPAYAPATGTPEVGGFASYEGLDLMAEIKTLNFTSFDVVEVLPFLDHTQTTAYLAGACAHQFLAILAWQKEHGLR